MDYRRSVDPPVAGDRKDLLLGTKKHVPADAPKIEKGASRHHHRYGRGAHCFCRCDFRDTFYGDDLMYFDAAGKDLSPVQEQMEQAINGLMIQAKQAL